MPRPTDPAAPAPTREERAAARLKDWKRPTTKAKRDKDRKDRVADAKAARGLE